MLPNIEEDYDQYLKDFVALMGFGLGRDFSIMGQSAFAWLRYERSVSEWADAEGYEVGYYGVTLLVGAQL